MEEESKTKGIYDKGYYSGMGKDYDALGGIYPAPKRKEEPMFNGLIEDNCENCNDTISFLNWNGEWYHKHTNTHFMKRCIYFCQNLHKHKIKDRKRCTKPQPSQEALEYLTMLSKVYPYIKANPDRKKVETSPPLSSPSLKAGVSRGAD
jgi:hypothetical protein